MIEQRNKRTRGNKKDDLDVSDNELRRYQWKKKRKRKEE
jgi:hypothetical protein